MQYKVEVKPGLVVELTIDEEPGSNALNVSATADMTRAFCFGEFGLRGGDRTFGGRLPEGINLIEDVVSPIVSPATSPIRPPVARCFSVAPIRQPAALLPSPSVPELSFDRNIKVKVVDTYRSREDVPAPPPEKPWLRPGGIYELDANRQLCVRFRRVQRQTYDGEPAVFWILAFEAVRGNRNKTFANSMRPQAQREKDALKWLQSFDNAALEEKADSDNDVSESDSTLGLIV